MFGESFGIERGAHDAEVQVFSCTTKHMKNGCGDVTEGVPLMRLIPDHSAELAEILPEDVEENTLGHVDDTRVLWHVSLVAMPVPGGTGYN